MIVVLPSVVSVIVEGRVKRLDANSIVSSPVPVTGLSVFV